MRKLNWQVLVPIVAMAAVASFGILFHGATTGSSPGLLRWLLSPGCGGTHVPATPAEFTREAAFFNFVAASQLLIVVQVASVLIALFLLRKVPARWIIVVVIVGLAAAILPNAKYSLTTSALMARAILRQCTKVGELLIMQERIGAFAAALLTCSLGALLTRIPEQDQVASELAARFERHSWILYAGTLLLVVSVLRLGALYAWIVAAEPQSSRDAVSSLASGVLRMWGIYYSTLLAAIYLPSYFLLRARAQALVAEKATAKDRQAWLEDRGLSLSIPDVLRRLVAILAPLIAGEVNKLLNVL